MNARLFAADRDRSLRELTGRGRVRFFHAALILALFGIVSGCLFTLAKTFPKDEPVDGRIYELEYAGPDFETVEIAGKKEDSALLTGYGKVSPVLVSLVPRMRNFRHAEEVLPSPLSGRLSSPFGWRKHPITRRKDFHTGIDIAADRGTPVLSVEDGYVEFAGWAGNYGRLVVVRHSDGLSTLYAHLDSMSVSKGSAVDARMILGRVGKTGRTTGYHLHFETRVDGTPVDPLTKVSFIDNFGEQ